MILIRLKGVERQRFSTPFWFLTIEGALPSCSRDGGAYAHQKVCLCAGSEGSHSAGNNPCTSNFLEAKMSTRLLFRYAGGLACLVTALALVGCGGGPGAQPEPKEIGNIAFRQGEQVRTIPLSDKFSGSDLTYSATTSNRSVATVTVDNEVDTLTVRAVGPGTATITVTAKNSQGKVDQDFTVTVPQPPAPDPVVIPDIPSLDATRTIPLGDKFSGENLTYGASSSNVRVATVTVDNTADTLTVTAVGPGTATITVTATAQGRAAQTQTFTVTVPQPADEEVAPTVRTGAQTTVTVAQGATVTITLSTVFTGTGLSFTESSSATAVATASESGGTLTITGVSVGSATITVTATNAAGSSPAHAISVTVAEPEDGDSGDQTPQPSTTCRYPPAVRVTINLDRTKQCIIPKGHTLNPDSSGVSVREDPSDRTDTVWLVTADTKGTHDITVHDGNGRPVAGKITVVVPNSLPFRNSTPDPATAISLGTGTNHTVEDRSVTPTLHTYFGDEDDEDEAPFLYRIIDQPEWVLIETKDGFLVTDRTPTSPETTIKSTTTELYMEVLNEMEGDSTFTVSLVASDGSDESELPVVLTFQADTDGLLPRQVTTPPYMSQQTENGALGKEALKVGPRRGVIHTLEFTQFGSVAGFKFVADLTTGATSRLNERRLPDTGLGTTPGFFYRAGSSEYAADGTARPTAGDTDWVAGYNYYVISSSGAAERPRWAAATLADDPQVTFNLKESGSSGTITISYYVVYAVSDLRDAQGNDITPTPDVSTSATLIGSKSLTVTVVNCSSPPDPIEKCP